MSKYDIKIEFLSDVLVGSGESLGAIIDTDSVFDDIGLPYIPSKRIKGILLESAQMLNAMLEQFNYNIPIDEIFGKPGIKEGDLKIDNFYFDDYENIYNWLKYLSIQYSPIINKQRIVEQLTSLRNSTAIDEKLQIAKKHSLRKERVINKQLSFIGAVEFNECYENYLAIICQNVRRIGTKRNRGLGEIEIMLFKDSQKVFTKNMLEEVLK